MLGELIAEGKGKRTARPVVATEPMTLVEVSFEDMTTMLGVTGMNIGTYVSSTRLDGTMSGEGKGVLASVEGDFVTWKGNGVGKLLAGGAVSYRGRLTYTIVSLN